MSETVGIKDVVTDYLLGANCSRNSPPPHNERTPTKPLIPHSSQHQHTALNKTPLIINWPQSPIHHRNPTPSTPNQVTTIIPTQEGITWE